MGFKPSLCESEIYIQKNINLNLWEYIATYADDLALILLDPEQFIKQLQSKPFNFRLKGSGPISFHLVCGFNRDPVPGSTDLVADDSNDSKKGNVSKTLSKIQSKIGLRGTLCQDPKKDIEKMKYDYVRWFGKMPNPKIKSPLEKGDHPELESTEFLEQIDIQKYQSMIGSLQ